MQAVILAGGKGTRLRPFTSTLPKPLVPVGDFPIIEVVLRQLRHFGFCDVVISTGHLAELIEAYCGNGRRWHLKIRYVREEKPLSTAGALKLIRRLDRDFLTINGDILTTLDFRKIFRFHRASGAAATLGVCERQTELNFGVIGLDAVDRLQAYTEKPALRHLVSQGINVFSREVLSHIKPGESIGIPDLIRRLRAAGKPVMGYRNRSRWLDIGRADDYQAAQDIFASAKERRRYLR